MKTYKFLYRRIERVTWNTTRLVEEKTIEGTIPELRERFGLKEYENIIWERNSSRESKKVCTPQRLRDCYNYYHRVHGEWIWLIKE